MPGLPLRTSAESGAGRWEGSEAVLGDPMPRPLISGSAVRKLWVGEPELYRQHLLRLDAESRRNRFGGAVSDEFIRRYSGPSTLNGAVIYGFFVKGVLRGAAELRLLARAGEAEAALSVERAWQSQAILDVPAQLAKRREHSNGSPERRPRERRYERLVLVDNWR